MAKVVVEGRSIKKTYGDRLVVDGLSFEIYRGECFGLLGPNGAGKSSTMRMVYGSTALSGGELFVLGLNVKSHIRDIKARIGVVPQDDGLDPDFSVLDNLLVYASFHYIPKGEALLRAEKLLSMLKIEQYAQAKVETLSGGLRRRLTIGRGLINNPDLLILDEPSTGLDPQARLFIWEYLRRLKHEGKTLLLTTHYMEEAEFLCDRIGIIDHGKMLALGTPKELIFQYVGVQVVEFAVKPEDVNYYANRLKEARFEYMILQSRIFVFLTQERADELQGQERATQEILKIISSESIVIRKPGLNDVFLRLAGHELRD